ncbi:SIMPL domain-containing protein [Pseudorhodoferax sp.]|uniref:SIMPL domain-containing protein n=1 Tax=Pseudorhodoferax sp. TaxID=1993553 RepID=UPI002DD65F8C|nr:SIMPL domain-containing protein [Pseudorhodoferax sp.]
MSVLRLPSSLLLACLGAAILLPAHAQGVLPVPQNVVQLSASGVVEVPQDFLSLTLSTTREAPDAATVQTQLKAAVDAALAEARKAAQPGQMEVRSGAFSLYPRHNKEGRISTWQGTAEIVLEGRDFGRISSTAGRVSALTVSQVAFSLSREERARVEAQAQTMAITQFKAKAGDIARGFGFSDYSLREVSVMADEGGMPRPRAMAMQAKGAYADSAPVPVEAGKSTVTVTVSGGVQLR